MHFVAWSHHQIFIRILLPIVPFFMKIVLRKYTSVAYTNAQLEIIDKFPLICKGTLIAPTHSYVVINITMAGMDN